MANRPYRGKTKDGKWVYGWYKYDPYYELHLISYHEKHVGMAGGGYWREFEVIPETVGQSTGLKDKNGQEIYEGDIITLSYGIPPTVDRLVIEYVDDEVVADISVSGWWMRNIRSNGCSASLCKTYEGDIEIIGSIHDTPELLEEPK